MELEQELLYTDELVIKTPAGDYAFDAEFTCIVTWEGRDPTPCDNCDDRGIRCSHMSCSVRLKKVEVLDLTVVGEVHFFPPNTEHNGLGYPMPSAALTEHPVLMQKAYAAVEQYAERWADKPEYEDFVLYEDFVDEEPF